MITPVQSTIDVMEKDDVRRQVLVAADAASAKKGEDVVVLDVGDIIAITDFFAIVNGANDRQVKTIVEEVELRLKEEEGITPLRVEGMSDRRWVLMDYGDFWVHVFHRDVRGFYDLERLWSDAPQVPYEEPGAATG